MITDSGGNVEVMVVRITMTEPSGIVLVLEDTTTEGAGVMTVVISAFGELEVDEGSKEVVERGMDELLVDVAVVVVVEDPSLAGGVWPPTGCGGFGHGANSVVVGENDVYSNTITTGTWTVVVSPAARKIRAPINPRTHITWQNLTGWRRSQGLAGL